jgi:hypothetical protein
LREIQKQLLMDQEANRKKERDADIARKKRQSEENKKVIKKGVASGKAKRKRNAAKKNNQKTKKKNESDSESESDSEEEEDERPVRPSETWKILFPYEDDKGVPMFAVDIFVDPKEDGADEHYATRDNIADDGAAELIDTYIKENCNYPPWNQPYVPKTPPKTTPKKRRKKESKKREEPKITEVIEKEKTPCRHNEYRPMMTYMAEENPGYCKQNCYLWKSKCAGCEALFICDKNEEGESKWFRASSATPVYCCVNMDGVGNTGRPTTGCKHALCFQCWTVGTLSDSSGPPKRATRARPRG